MTEQAGFPLPSQIADVPGAEDWRSMYQYFTRFQPEDDKRFWFYNSMHFPEPMPAFDTITGEVPYQAIGANTARGLKICQAGASAISARITRPQTIPIPCRMRSNSPTIVPAVCVSDLKTVKATAATTGKKISAPIQTMSAR